MNIKPINNRLDEICANCGCTFGSHCGVDYYSKEHQMQIPANYCPGHEGGMDWDKGPGTTFAPTGEYKEDKE